MLVGEIYFLYWWRSTNEFVLHIINNKSNKIMIERRPVFPLARHRIAPEKRQKVIKKRSHESLDWKTKFASSDLKFHCLLEQWSVSLHVFHRWYIQMIRSSGGVTNIRKKRPLFPSKQRHMKNCKNNFLLEAHFIRKNVRSTLLSVCTLQTSNLEMNSLHKHAISYPGT